jgi:hypothetical protein
MQTVDGDALKQAVATLIQALREDKSPNSYYYAWQANIAMAFQDVMPYKTVTYSGEPVAVLTHADAHYYANEAAKNFLNLLTKDNANTEQ